RRGCMPLFSARVPPLGRELEAGEFEPGRHRAADQGPFAETFGRLPHMCRHDGLRALAGGKIGAEPQARHWAGLARRCEREGRARVPVPDLDRVEAMPMRALAAREQEMDRGRRRASALDAARVAKRLAEVPAFRMRLEIEQPDDVGGGEHGSSIFRKSGHRFSVENATNHGIRSSAQDLFFLARTSANTCAAGLPASPTATATAGTSARRKTFARFSSPIVVGIVAWPAATCRFASVARVRRSLLPGSLV